MTRKRTIVDLALILIAGPLFGICGSVTYNVTLSATACHEVRLGRFSPPDGPVLTTGEVDSHSCRPKIRSGSETELYITAACSDGFPWVPAQQRYVIDLSGVKGTRRVSEAEWETGNELPFNNNGPKPRTADNAVAYKGPPLPRSGPKWEGVGRTGPPRALLSPAEDRAAVNSWDGFDITYSFLDPTSVFKRNKVEGRYWIDLYETATARPLVRIEGSFHNAVPHEFQELGAGWYSDRFYVMPVGPTAYGTYHFNLRRLLICDIDAAARKGDATLKERR